jgi:CubicO group peptidase (beta-lactamase class C family)
MKKKIIAFVQCLLGYGTIFCCSAQSNKPAANLPVFIQATIDSLYAKQQFPGILVGIRTGRKNEYFTAGYAQTETKKPFNANTFFEAGSITKTFTAYVLQSVLRDFKISDTADILSFLPDSVQQNTGLQKINFLMLMNHTAGLPRLPDNMPLKENDLQPYAGYNSQMLFEFLALAKPPGKKRYVYSNLGMALAGVLAERISGKSYAALLDKYIFLPFKIVNAENSITKSNNKSQGYLDDTTKAVYWNMNVMAPAGGLKCSAKEMLRYLGCMSKPINKKSADIIESLLQPTFTLSSVTKVGRAWHIQQQKGKPTVYWHNGGTYGFSTFAAFLKGTDQAVIIVINRFDKNEFSDKLGFTIMKKMQE